MWLPPERIRHALPVAAPKTAEEASRGLLFSALPLRSGLVLASRAWVPAMVPWRATDDGFVTDEVLAWYGRFAAGRPGAIVVEATGIRDVPSGPLLRAGHDRYMPGLRALADEVRARSGGATKLFIQLIDFLAIKRRPERARFLAKFLSITDEHRRATGGLDDDEVRGRLLAMDDAALSRALSPRELESLQFGYRERVTDVHLPHIRELPVVLPGLFADAAARVRDAGFDGVELHYAHAYTMASFLSRTNVRDDGYGGTPAGRVRLAREVLEAVRARTVGFTVGCRILCDEIVEGGSTVDDACAHAVALGPALDFLSLSTGGKFDDAKQPAIGEAAYPYTGQSGYECMPSTISDARGPFGRNVHKQARIRAALRASGVEVPTVVAGGIGTFDQAEAILAQGQGDLIGAARQSLADPDWLEKVRLGRGAEVRRCKYTNYCEALDQRHKQVTCQLWDRTGLEEQGLLLSKDGRRRLVAPPWSPAGTPEHEGVADELDGQR